METSQKGGEESSVVTTVLPQKNRLLSQVRNYQQVGIAVLAVVLIVIGIALLIPRAQEERVFAEQYTLVPDKISASAPIVVLLPENATFVNFDPAQSLSFSPAIKGKWDTPTPEAKNNYRFIPDGKLTVGAYHLVTLNTPEMKMEKMFTIDKDPTVLAVFPKQETEVNEYTSVTIMFSRPMVPLSTLSVNADITPPVEITPKTEGRFKWITTRTLQFIPATRLLRSSKYAVLVKDGMSSVDGVLVPSFSHTFTTRTLGYQSQYANQYSTLWLGHDAPFRVYFNQPFNLEKTRGLVTLTSSASLAPLSVVAAYGTRSVRDEKTGKLRTLTDQSVLELFPDKDMHGREYLWNFGQSYTIAISGAVPLEGDVTLTQPMSQAFTVSPIIENVSALSPRSSSVNMEVFDPAGTMKFSMSEPVDIAASRISGKGMQKITFGEHCAEPEAGEEVQMNTQDCKKVDDKKTLILSFDSQAFGRGETGVVTMEKLVNINGVTLNTSTLTQQFTTFRNFEILRTTPAEGGTMGNLTTMQICSTNPIATPLDDEFYKKIRSNMMIGKWNWDQSIYVSENTFGTPLPGIPSTSAHCPIGAFETTIRYGLVPKFAYELTLDLTDHFGQSLTRVVHFVTKDADPLAKGFIHLQPIAVMTSPTKTTLAYGLDFMNEVDLTVCKVSPQTMLTYRTVSPSIEDGSASLNCTERKMKHLTLPESYATRKYLKVDIKDYYPNPIGNYVFIFSNPGYRRVTQNWEKDGNTPSFTLGEPLYEKTYVTVTALAVGSKQVERDSRYNYYNDGDESLRNIFMADKWPSNLYWVNDFAALTAVPGAIVTPYVSTADTSVLSPLAPQLTNGEGIALVPSKENIVGAVVTLGNDSAIISNYADSLSWAQNARPAQREYIYTDRPIYRPGDTVHIKGISRIGYDGVYEATKGTTKLEIHNARYEIARTENVTMSKNGTFETTFTIDNKAPLGYYSFNTSTGGYGSFQVEEYVAPQFKIELAPDKEEYISGDTAKVNISADYYFGVPVQGGSAEYRIVTQDYYFDRYHDGYFSFGRSWYDNENGWYGDRFLLSGKLALSKAGKGTITQELNIDKLFTGNYKNKSKVITVYVTVKNENGQSVSKQQSFIVHRGTFYAGIIMDDYFLSEGGSGKVRIKTVDVKGKAIGKNKLTLLLEKTEWKSYKRQEVDGNFYYRTERVKTKVEDVSIDTDRDGDGVHEFKAGVAGEYELTISGTDGDGNTVSAQYDFYVSGQSAVAVRPTNNATLELISEKTDLGVGDTGSFVIKSPYMKAKALVTLARGKTYEYKILDINSQLTRYQFAATEGFIPNVVASVLLLSPLPEMKYGEVNYTIGTKEKELAIAITSSKKKYLPGEEVELDIVVKDSKGNPVEAELSLSVVDMSVLALVGNPKKNLVTFFYGGEPLTIRTAMNVKNILTVAEIPVGTKGGSGGGGDDLEKKKRGVFRDTAYWNGVIQSDANGRAHVKFTLPDNLTQWQVESVGITTTTKVGAGYSDFIARKSVMAVPQKPRFILPGDNFAVGGTVFNETDTTQKLTISVLAPTLTLTGSRETTISVEPHTSLTVSFPATAPESIVDGRHEFTLLAKNADYEDVVVSSFPIERNNTFEFTATAGRVTDGVWKEQLYLPLGVIPDRGGLTLSLSATMASVLDSAIRGMIVYPYECTEQVGSKLRTIALVKEHAKLFGTESSLLTEKVTFGNQEYTIDQIVNNGLAKLYQNQYQDGGMPYYANLPANFNLTLATLETYIDLKKAGYAVDEVKLIQSARYVYNYINFPRIDMPPTTEDIIASSYVLARLGNNALWESTLIHDRLVGFAGDKNLVKTGLSTPALAYLAILASNEQFDPSLVSRLFAEFENRSRIDARGTTVGENSGVRSAFSENSVTNTALALKAFSEAKRESPLLEGYVRAMKTGKTRDGGWGSTYNSITAIDAMTTYITWKNEANANMKLSVTLDKKPLLDTEYTKKNVLVAYDTVAPMSALAIGKSQTVEFLKTNLGESNDAFYYDMSLKYFLPAASIAPRDEGFSVTRALYAQDDTEFLRPVTSATQGDVLHGRVIISVPTTRLHVALEDFIPAGVEIVNQRLATEDQGLGNNDGYSRALGVNTLPRRNSSWLATVFSFGEKSTGPTLSTDGMVTDDMYGNRNTVLQPLYPSAIENHDDRIFVYIERLEPGEYVYDYYVRALIPGVYQYLPLVVSELYTPENFGRTAGSMFTVIKKSE